MVCSFGRLLVRNLAPRGARLAIPRAGGSAVGRTPRSWVERDSNPPGRGFRDHAARRTVSGMANALVPRVVDAVERVTARAADADELLAGVATEIGKAVPYDGAMWFGLDPTTLLAVSPARMEHLDDGYCSTFWFGE